MTFQEQQDLVSDLYAVRVDIERGRIIAAYNRLKDIAERTKTFQTAPDSGSTQVTIEEKYGHINIE